MRTARDDWVPVALLEDGNLVIGAIALGGPPASDRRTRSCGAVLKLRSMIKRAEAMLPQLLEMERDAGNKVLFKLRNDPFVTPIGGVIRRFSLDEPRQSFNVLDRSMSLVRPRPSLRSEMEKHADFAHHRFFVRPGITELRQVSGRSTLSCDEAVQLDQSYVENGTLLADFVILSKTVRVVLRPRDSAA